MTSKLDLNYFDNFNNFDYLNSEWGLSFSNRSYPEKTQKKV